MTEKRIVCITDVCSSIFAGGDAPKKQFSFEQTEDCCYPVFSNGESNNGLYGYTNTARVTEPSITVSARGTIGFTAIRLTPFTPIVRLISITPIQDIIDIDYLYYALSNYTPENTGTSIPQLTVPMIKKYKFRLPEKDEQKRAVKVLKQIDNILEKEKKQIQKLDELIKSRFVEMFGDPVINSKEFSVFSLQEMIDNSYIVYHLDGNHGGDYPRNEEFVSEGVPYIGANCIDDGTVSFRKAKYLTQERANRLRKGIAKNNDVLFAHNATVGPVAILKTTKEKIILSTSLTAYRCNTNKILPLYLRSYMQSEGFIRQYANDMKQTTRNQVPITAQKKYLFIVPPLELQIKYADFVSQVDKSKTAVKQSIKKLETLKKSLMQEYFG